MMDTRMPPQNLGLEAPYWARPYRLSENTVEATVIAATGDWQGPSGSLPISKCRKRTGAGDEVCRGHLVFIVRRVRRQAFGKA